MKLKQIRVDGYKNLIDCEINLGDFNVLVGPNNSGKSNLLEVFRMLWFVCFGSESDRGIILQGFSPSPQTGYSWVLCHIEKYAHKPITIGINFEILVKQKKWDVDYEIKIQCSHENKKNRTILAERLTAKIAGKPGRRTEYIQRNEKDLRIHKKPPYRIANNNVSLQAVRSLYPDFEDLPPEFRNFYKAISLIAEMKTFAFSPRGLREKFDEEKDIEGSHISSFDLLLILDKLKGEGKYYELFRETMCDIFDLKDFLFKAEDTKLSPDKKGKELTTRNRYLFIKKRGNPWSLFREYSDGTFVVAAILASLFSEDDRGPILCLDELENCLHPAAVEKLLHFLQDNADKWPVLVTTHSPYVLNGVNPEDVNVAVVDETGATHFEKVKSTKQLRDYLNRGLMSFGDLLPSNFEEVLGNKK